MTFTANILAEGGAWQLVWLLVVVVISIVASMVKKKQEQKAAQQRPPGRGEPTHPGQAAPPQQRPATEAERQSLVAAAMKSMGIEVPQRPPARPPAKAAGSDPPPAPPKRKQSKHSGEGIEKHIQKHLRMPEAQRTAPGGARRRTGVRLTPAAARRAMIFHEILSPPKALRTGGDMWDQ